MFEASSAGFGRSYPKIVLVKGNLGKQGALCRGLCWDPSNCTQGAGHCQNSGTRLLRGCTACSRGGSHYFLSCLAPGKSLQPRRLKMPREQLESQPSTQKAAWERKWAAPSLYFLQWVLNLYQNLCPPLRSRILEF